MPGQVDDDRAAGRSRRPRRAGRVRRIADVIAGAVSSGGSGAIGSSSSIVSPPPVASPGDGGTAERLHHPAHHRQADAHPVTGAVSGPADAIELVEQARQVRVGHAGPVVREAQG